MIPAGYMAKRVYKKADWPKQEGKRAWLEGKGKHSFLELAPQVVDIYSVSGCISENFADYIPYWKHNGYWLFDSPTIIRNVARENLIQLDETSLFYYEVHEREFNGKEWQAFAPQDFPTRVEVPAKVHPEGFDVVTFYARNSPGCSPLSCNAIAEELRTNSHCLFDCFDDAEAALNHGAFKNAEPGPYRVFAVYSVDWS